MAKAGVITGLNLPLVIQLARVRRRLYGPFVFDSRKRLFKPEDVVEAVISSAYSTKWRPVLIPSGGHIKCGRCGNQDLISF